MHAYSVNLVIYRMAEVAPYDPPMSLAAIPELGKSVILNRKKTETPQNPPTPSPENPGHPALISSTEASVSNVGNSMASNDLKGQRACNHLRKTKTLLSTSGWIVSHQEKKLHRTLHTLIAIMYLIQIEVWNVMYILPEYLT